MFARSHLLFSLLAVCLVGSAVGAGEREDRDAPLSHLLGALFSDNGEESSEDHDCGTDLDLDATYACSWRVELGRSGLPLRELSESPGQAPFLKRIAARPPPARND